MSDFSSDIEIEIVSERLSDHYLMSPNDLHRGKGPWQGLTPGARCLLAALLTYQSGWKLRRDDVDEIMAPLGRRAVDTILRELQGAGFIARVRGNAGGGRFVWQWKVRLRPDSEQADKNVSAGRTIRTLPIDGEPVDGERVDGGDQGKQDVSAGRTIRTSTIDGEGAPNRRNSVPEELKERTTSYATTASPSSRPHDETTSAKKPTAKKTSRAADRGTRIPDDFTVTPEMHAWAKENVPELAGRRETEKFINHWVSKPGKDGRKIDWVRTWKNWMIEASERLAARGPRPTPANGNGSTPPFRSSRRENPFAGLDVVKSSDIIREMQEAQA